jgi:threonine dehydrogenase-like Zn-dependent dehydrogenase
MKMRSALIVEPGRVEVVEVPRPDPGRDEVLLELEGCGLCGSELPVFEGRPWFSYPREPGAPGHEGWGRVLGRGAGTSGPAEGARVAALSFHAHAQFDLAAAEHLVELPPALDGTPFPGEALACAVNIAARAGLRAGGTAAVVGTGFIGSLLVQLAARAGMRTIAVCRRRSSLQAARNIGAAHAFAAEEALERVDELTGGQLCDVVVEATGRQAPLDLAAQLTRVRGRLVIAGFHQDGPRSIDMQLWNWRGLDVINAHERDPRVYLAGLRRAVALVAAGELDPAPLYTHEFPLERAQEAFDVARDRPDGFAKAVLRP